MLSDNLKYILEMVVVDDEDEECDECEKEDKYKPSTTRMKVYDAGNQKMWMPEGTEIQNLDLIINEILEKAKYWGGGFSMSGGSGGKMKVTRKPVIWGTDERPSEKEARVAAVAAHNRRIKQKIAQAISKRKIIQFPKPAIQQQQPMRKAV